MHLLRLWRADLAPMPEDNKLYVPLLETYVQFKYTWLKAL